MNEREHNSFIVTDWNGLKWIVSDWNGLKLILGHGYSVLTRIWKCIKGRCNQHQEYLGWTKRWVVRRKCKWRFRIKCIHFRMGNNKQVLCKICYKTMRSDHLRDMCVPVTKVQVHLLSTFSIELIAIILTVNRCVRCLVDCGLQQKQHNLVTMAHSSSSNNIQNILKG